MSTFRYSNNVMVPLIGNRKNLIVFTLVVLALGFAACSDDDGFRDDPRSSDATGNSVQKDGPPGANPSDDFEPEPGQLPGRMHGNRTHGIWPQVWSQHAPSIQSWEYKVNCSPAASHAEHCFLSDLTSVKVTTPSGELIELEKDFNTNGFSGEVTRRWVLYGPKSGDLPEKGDYVFSYSRGSELMYEQVVSYDSGVISYPTGIEWKRSAKDIVVNWNPPPEASEEMHYKALIWQAEDTPEVFISDVFDWDADTAVLKDVPMIVGGKYSLNVAIYFDDGYAYSEYVVFEWPESADSGY